MLMESAPWFSEIFSNASLKNFIELSLMGSAPLPLLAALIDSLSRTDDLYVPLKLFYGWLTIDRETSLMASKLTDIISKSSIYS